MCAFATSVTQNNVCERFHTAQYVTAFLQQKRQQSTMYAGTFAMEANLCKMFLNQDVQKERGHKAAMVVHSIDYIFHFS